MPPEGEAAATGTTETPAVENPLAGSPLGASTESGTSTEAGTNSESPQSGAAGEESTSGAEGADALTVESYKDLKIPEGVTLDEATMGQFKDFAVTNGLKPEAAQAALDMHLSLMNKSAEAFVAQQQTAWKETTDGWKAELEADPEFSGEAKVKSQIAIGKLLDEYGTPATRAAFELTGAGWNPAIVKFVHNIAKALGEGTQVPGGGPPKQQAQTLGGRLYPDAS